MSCSKCNRNTCNCIISQEAINCDPCTQSTYCPEKIDTDCVYYHLCKPKDPSKLTCLGLPSNTSLTLILEEIDKRLCGFIGTFGIIGQDTNTVDTTVTSALNIYTIKSDVRIDPASTLPYSISAAGLKLDCCVNDCSGVTTNVGFDFDSLTKGNNFFATLQPQYFTKSDSLISLNLVDDSIVTGDSITYIKYQLLPTGIDIITATGDPVTLGINKCGKDIINGTFPLSVELMTSNGCFDYKICNAVTNRVNYSERFNYPYRANFQINDIPIIPDINTSSSIDKGILYFNDVKATNASTSFGSVLRKINLNTKEVLTISGIITGGSGVVTINGATGDVVGYDYLSGPVIDTNEMSNDEPVIYATTFGNGSSIGPCVVRVIKEKNNECDERANWTTYVIAGNSSAVPGNIPLPPSVTPVTGSAARFAQIYGLKKWFEINGEPSFLIVDAGNSVIKLLYYSGTGTKNSSVNWRVSYFGLNIPSGLDRNINVDDIIGGKRIIMMIAGIIYMYDFTVPTPNLADISNIANYALTYTIGSGIATDVDGLIANPATTVSYPMQVFKYTDYSTSDEYYIWTNGGPGVPAPNATNSVLRRTECPSPLNISSLITANANLFGTSGLLSTNVSGYSQGFFKDLQNNYYDLTMGGFRLWNLDTAPLSCSIYCGGSNALDTQTEWSGLGQPYMDTQYEFDINC